MSKGQSIGYVRVSTADQNTERQLEGLQIDKVFTDHASGKDTNRPALSECLGYVRDGDELVVHSMDRLARSLVDLRRTVDDLTGRGVSVRFVKEGLTFTRDTSDPCAVLMLSVMGAVAEFERALLLERQREGIAIAKGKGVYKGRVPSLSAEQARELDRRMAEGESASAIARDYGVSRATVYNTRWTEADIVAVDDVYREHGLPGDEKHPTVQALAADLGRSPSAVYMRMVQLDYAHQEPGVYPGTKWHWTKLDRKVADRPSKPEHTCAGSVER
jgi:DNA invertase Pin-like site-specific DNA recombinase